MSEPYYTDIKPLHPRAGADRLPWSGGMRMPGAECGTVPYIRVTAVSLGDKILTVRRQGGGDSELLVDLRTPAHAYLAEIVRPGDSLNLIGPASDGRFTAAEFIIYDPDYLVNVTEIAACFEDYCTSPLAGIVNRFSTIDNTSAVNLGNFASQLLDEEINSRPDEDVDFRRASVEFFRNNAINLATCVLDSAFKQQAIEQKMNIRHAVRDILPQNVASFRTDRAILEPAFFSEMLGLQGRMDLLQSDYTVVLEQKSGKGAFSPGDDPAVPRHVRKHYVQLLLYMAIMKLNYNALFEANNRRINAFLMYSKYREPIVSLGMDSLLLRRALEVRNMSVAHTRRIAEGDLDWLLELTPETLAPNARGRFWERYIRPRFSDILDPFRSSDPLAISYFRRMLQFTAHEHRVAKQVFASAWQLSLEEKLEGGNIYAGMRLLEPTADHSGHVGEVILEFDDDETNDMANFRLGDAVILYAYPPGREPDVRSTMAFRCSITAIEARRIFLKLRFAQSSALPFREKADFLWAIEHDFMDSSFNGLYKGLHNFLTAPAARRDLLLFRRRPRQETSRTTTYDHGQFNTLALKAKQAGDFFLIIGPPGTGKTSFGLTTTLKEQLAEAGSSVLLISYTNRAVDEICSKLVEEGIDFMRVGSEMACDPAYRPYLIKEKVAACGTVVRVREAIKSMRVFTGTVSALNGAINLLSIKHFDLMIVDEASQILEPHLLPLLCRKDSDGRPAIGRFVMIGDHKQLPAVVQQNSGESEVTQPELNDICLTDCRLSLFERLLRRYGDDSSVTYMLTRQGRMHRDIADFPNRMFYSGRLDIAGLKHQTGALPVSEAVSLAEKVLTEHRVAFVDVPESYESGSSDKVNSAEAQMIADLAQEIVRTNADFGSDTLGIIVPYRNQIATIRKELMLRGLPAESITTDTVERYQGSQRKYIIYGFTARRSQQLSFLTDNTFTDTDGTLVDRKLNVAMTRAREHLILVGNAAILSAAPVFHSLITYCRERSAFYSR